MEGSPPRLLNRNCALLCPYTVVFLGFCFAPAFAFTFDFSFFSFIFSSGKGTRFGHVKRRKTSSRPMNHSGRM